LRLELRRRAGRFLGRRRRRRNGARHRLLFQACAARSHVAIVRVTGRDVAIDVGRLLILSAFFEIVAELIEQIHRRRVERTAAIGFESQVELTGALELLTEIAQAARGEILLIFAAAARAAHQLAWHEQAVADDEREGGHDEAHPDQRRAQQADLGDAEDDDEKHGRQRTEGNPGPRQHEGGEGDHGDRDQPFEHDGIRRTRINLAGDDARHHARDGQHRRRCVAHGCRHRTGLGERRVEEADDHDLVAQLLRRNVAGQHPPVGVLGELGWPGCEVVRPDRQRLAEQPHALVEMQCACAEGQRRRSDAECTCGHGRSERRQHSVVADPQRCCIRANGPIGVGDRQCMTDGSGGLRQHCSRRGDDVGSSCSAQGACVTARQHSSRQFGFSAVLLDEPDIRRQHDIAVRLHRLGQVRVRIATGTGLAEQPAQLLRLIRAAEIG
jgi:hypothetical protein